ncbi:MAG: DUF5627 domain-containing protein [Prevotellaceae bacterium]|nr:DUF5627 domain-containing protein [Prevotellaceae bacterium]
MEKRIYNWILMGALMALGASCESGDPVYSDFDYQTAYFAAQTPIRTVELGNDPEWDLSDDNNHCIWIKATMGGSYGNKKDIVLNYTVDESLCDNLWFAEEDVAVKKVTPMPTNYYTLDDDKLRINKGEILGGVKVELADAFFNDPLSIETTYVIPLRITGIVQGVDSILEDKDYVLYALKYINPWEAHYLRHGTDIVTSNGVVNGVARHYEYVENDEQVQTYTTGYLENSLPITYKDNAGVNYVVDLKLSFQEDGTCTVGSNTENVTATGTGKYVAQGEKESFGGKDRDALYLDYTVDIPDLNAVYQTVDTLVMQYRGVTQEYFSTVEQ